jgi:hypothetical protein
MHDARVARSPSEALRPFLGQNNTKFIVLCDHHGSGFEGMPVNSVEAQMADDLAKAGFAPSNYATFCFVPELEEVFIPVWEGTIRILGSKRDSLPISPFMSSTDPKEDLNSILRSYRLRSSPALFEELAQKLSIPDLKAEGSTLSRVANRLVRWFGTQQNQHND